MFPPPDRSHYRRFQRYDYTRGAMLFVTFAVAGRSPVFGRIEARGRLVHSPVGLAALETLKREAMRPSGIVLHRAVIMPDHVHLRLEIRPGLDQPLTKLAAFVRNFKRWSLYRAQKLGVTFAWETGYHDRLCLSREVIRLVDAYIDNNPLKWWLMHGHPQPLRVIEPLDSPRLPTGDWWSAVGSTGLFDESHRLCAIRLSRRIPLSAHAAVVARLMRAVDQGFVLMGTFISPCERAVWAALIARGAPVIRAVPDPLALVYRPKGDEPRLFAQQRLLLLSCVAAPGLTRSAAWHGINDALADAARAVEGGLGLYVVPGAGGQVQWKKV